MKVRKRAIYVYRPVPIDRYDAKTDLEEGELVRVIHPRGCPPPNTMNHCHVERISTGEFVGLVCCNSLERNG